MKRNLSGFRNLLIGYFRKKYSQCKLPKYFIICAIWLILIFNATEQFAQELTDDGSGEFKNSNRNSEVALIPLKTQNATNKAILKKKKFDLSPNFATLLGGTNEDRAHGLEADKQGNIYITAPIQSTDFPITPNALVKEFTGIYLAKFNSSGVLLLSTFIGIPGGANYAHDIAVDGKGNIYIAGNTTNPNFPTTSGTFQDTFKGPYDASVSHGDAFIMKLNPEGDKIIYSTFLGGTGPDICGKIAVDDKGNTYIIGSTSSKDFPVTPGAFQSDYKGGDITGRADLFVAKLSPDGSNLLYSTYIGGSGLDTYSDVAIDGDGSIFLTGSTTSPDFPTTLNAVSRSYMGASGYMGDAFLLKLNSIGTALEYATYIGGSKDEIARSIIVSSNGDIWLAGETESNDFPTTTDAYCRYKNEGTDGFFTRINTRDGTLHYSSLIGGNKGETMMMAGHRSGVLVLTGRTESPDFPVTEGKMNMIKGQSDIFVSLFDPSTKSVYYSNLLGGQGVDNPTVLICKQDHLYLAGNTTSIDFPVTTAAKFKGGTNPWGGDAFVMKFGFMSK